MNPFESPSRVVESYNKSWPELYPKPYDKRTASPFTKTRVILMNGTEFESVQFLHRFARSCADNELRRQIALIRNQEQQQQKRISCLKPLDETFLETTISYEQLAIELTAILAQNETDQNNIASLNHALLEDFDHLYRFANLLKMDYGIEAETIVGKLTEIMPGRPTVNEHRHPYDNIKYSMNAKTAAPYSKLSAGIITAAEQQTMNFYMNMAANYENDLGRRLFAEIAMVEEMHVTQYECLSDPDCTWLENWLMHEYTECYLYYSMMQDETDPNIKRIWEEHYEMEVAHCKCAAGLLQKYENKKVRQVIPNPVFPKLIRFGENIEYVRKVLADTVYITSDREQYVDARKLPKSANFFRYNDAVNDPLQKVASHNVIAEAAEDFGGTDYRYQTSAHPVPALGDRKRDNTSVGKK